MRVGFAISHTSESWMGGINYLANLLYAIESWKARTLEPVLLVSPSTPSRLLAAFPSFERITTAFVDFDSRASLLRKATKAVLRHDPLMEGLMRRYNLSLLSHSGHLGRNGRIPTLGWIPDFQHRRMPEFFSQAELTARDSQIGRLCDNCTAVLVSSQDAQNDLRGFHPGAAEKSHVLPFVSWLKPPRTDDPAVLERYSLPGRYFHLPNQFWAHKNHGIVLDALDILRSRGHSAVVVATGNTYDSRHPNYFDELLRRRSHLRLNDNFHTPGLVSKADLSGLMASSVAVLNPSLFEGWSTTVEEAKSMGKNLLLSEIPVHREQSPSRAVYFNPRDPHQLASAMENVLDSFTTQEEAQYMNAASKALPARIVAYAMSYGAIASNTVDRSSHITSRTTARQ